MGVYEDNLNQQQQQHPVVNPYQPYGEQQHQVYHQPADLQLNNPNAPVQQPYQLPQPVFNQQPYVQNPMYMNQQQNIYPQPVYAQADPNPAPIAQPEAPRNTRRFFESFVKALSNYHIGLWSVIFCMFLSVWFLDYFPLYIIPGTLFGLTCGSKYIKESEFIQNNHPRLWNYALYYIVCGVALYAFVGVQTTTPFMMVVAGVIAFDVYSTYLKHSDQRMSEFHKATIISATIISTVLFIISYNHIHYFMSPVLFGFILIILIVACLLKYRQALHSMSQNQTVLPTDNVTSPLQVEQSQSQLAAEQQETFNNIQQSLEQQRMSQQHVIQQ
ncbi:ftsK [Acrasis kona]|uniref:FtsK n=1 Tax=Acrasis kona TaxID=1008807 RepID=A0AAW2YHZ5_9EUKA